MKIKHKDKDITHLVTSINWQGSRIQVARKLDIKVIQDYRDTLLPVIEFHNGETVYMYDDKDKLLFQGNIYQLEKDEQSSILNIMAYDNLFILSKSRTTRKFTNITAEDIATSICQEMGIKVGELAKTGVKVSFIADNKTGYEIIMTAYTEAKKVTKKLYQTIMNGDKLDVVEKGTLIEDFEIDSSKNVENVTFKESIENMVNKVMITDEQGNTTDYKTNEEWIKKYSMIQAVYKTNPNQNTSEEVEHLLKGPERSATINVLGDVRALSSYSVKIRTNSVLGQFWIKSDNHSFINGIHSMSLEIEFENIMNEQKADKEKEDKGTEKKTTEKKGKDKKIKGGGKYGDTKG